MFIRAVAQIPKPAAGTIIRHSSFYSKYVSARNVDVWLPEGYTKQKRYPVLYMHDGQMLFDASITWNKQEWGVDETLTSLIQSEKIEPCIVVGIWNGERFRHADYFPQKPLSYLSKEQIDTLYSSFRNNGQSVFQGENIRSDNYIRFLTEELKPFIDSAYKTKPGRKHTFIAGSSMGGLISLYAICEYPNIFGGAACLSTHWPGIFYVEGNPFPDATLRYLEEHLSTSKHKKIYFDLGTATLDALYPPLQEKIDALMSQKGFTNTNWKTIVFSGDDHSEEAWKKRLSIPILFLMGKN